jgi:hypothetical protein
LVARRPTVGGIRAPILQRLKLEPGAAVKLTEADFVRLAKAFFDELEKKFS